MFQGHAFHHSFRLTAANGTISGNGCMRLDKPTEGSSKLTPETANPVLIKKDESISETAGGG